MSVMIERSSAWFERYLVPPLGALASSVYLQAVRDAFIIFTLPLILAGSVFLVVANPPPIPGLQALIAPYQSAILVPFQLSFGIMALFLSFGVAYSLAQYRRTEPVQPGILAMVLFLVATMPIRDITTLTLGEILPFLGGQVLLVAIVIGIVTTEVVRWFRGSRFTIRLPKNVPPNVTRAFEALVPTLLLLTLVWALEWFVSSYTYLGTDHQVHQFTLPILLTRAIQPLVVLQQEQDRDEAVCAHDAIVQFEI